MNRNFYKYIISFLFLSFTQTLYCQQDCERNLKKALVLFEKGYLEDIPGLLEPCIDAGKGFTWSSRSAALQLLTETFLFSGEEEKAEKYYMLLLENNPSYKPKLKADHPELVYLAEKFSVKPKVSISGRLGFIFPSIENSKTYFLEDSLCSATDNYKGISKLQFGLAGDFNLNHSNFDLSAEVLFTNIGYELTTDMQFPEPGIIGSLSFEEQLNFIDFGLNLKYNFKALPIGGQPKHSSSRIKVMPYFSVGFWFNLLYKARMENLDFNKIDLGNIEFIDKQQTTGIDLLEGSSALRNNLNYSASLTAGLKIILGDQYFGFFDFRYNKMLNSFVNDDNRYNNEELMQRFRHLDNDISINSFVISVGIGYTLSRSVKKVKP